MSSRQVACSLKSREDGGATWERGLGGKREGGVSTCARMRGLMSSRRVACSLDGGRTGT